MQRSCFGGLFGRRFGTVINAKGDVFWSIESIYEPEAGVRNRFRSRRGGGILSGWKG